MKKSIGLSGIFCISAGAMISSGLFILPGLAFAKAGPSVFVSYFIAGLVALTTVLSLSELITAMPKAGGDYYYVSRTFGQLFGTVSGLLSWLALSLKSAFAVIGIAELIYLTFGINLTISAVILTIIFTAINLYGVQEAVKFQVALVVALILILIAFFGIGIENVQVQRYEEFFSHGLNAMFSTAGFVFVSFGGVLTTASIAGEIKNPSRNIPLGLIGSTIAVTLLYTVVTFVVVGTMPPDQLAASLAPIAIAGEISGGKILYYAIMIASLLAFITTANGGILTASRYPIALSEDGMMPESFQKTSKVKKTPFVAVIATGVLISLSVTLNLDSLIKAASTVILLSNIFAHLSVIVMRESRVSTYRPTYKSPFYPWLQIFGIIAFMLLIIDMGMEPILLSLLFTSAGVILYFVRRDSNHKNNSAIIHLVQRITNKELVSGNLQNELRTIVKDRDEIVHDEVDKVIKNSTYIELDKVIKVDELWQSVADKLSDELPEGESVEKLIEGMKTREQESSTVISDFVAIPHVIIEAKNYFKVILVKAKDGIDFCDDYNKVKAVFILIGSKDMRNLHLRTLAAIAKVVQEPDFEEDWLKANNHEELKDIFTLSKRTR